MEKFEVAPQCWIRCLTTDRVDVIFENGPIAENVIGVASPDEICGSDLLPDQQAKIFEVTQHDLGVLINLVRLRILNQ